MKATICLCVLINSSILGYSQQYKKTNPNNQQEVIKSVNCKLVSSLNDCTNALPVRAEGRVDFKCLPSGIGKLLEFNNNKLGNLYYFEKEHNSVWIRFKVIRDGIFSFKITPNDLKVDLDFLLFKKLSDDYVLDIVTKKIKPIRTNISKPDEGSLSTTGLSLSTDKKFVAAGKGEAFSKALEVKKGEEFLLAIDKVNKGGDGGFSLQFQYFDYTIISGTLIDDKTAEPLAATIVWEDAKTGEVLSKVNTNPYTGEFKLKVPFESSSQSASYILSTEREGYFFLEKNISASAVEHISAKPLVLLLPKLKKGLFAKINNINFYTGEDVVLPQSKSSLKRLKKIMKKNPHLTIRIDGHTNGCTPTIEEMQELSDSRSIAIKNFLINNQIDEDRIFVKGCNCSQMLFPNPKDEEEESRNRRVEILVLDY
jgi:outer membrane protein OmpA-like peptidoglycan-associated protein